MAAIPPVDSKLASADSPRKYDQVKIPEELTGLRLAQTPNGTNITPEAIDAHLENSINALANHISEQVGQVSERTGQPKKLEIVVPISGGLFLIQLALKKIPKELLTSGQLNVVFAMQTYPSSKNYLFSDHRETRAVEQVDESIILDDMNDSKRTYDDITNKTSRMATKIVPWFLSTKVNRLTHTLKNIGDVVPTPIIFEDQWIVSSLGLDGKIPFSKSIIDEFSPQLNIFERTCAAPFVIDLEEVKKWTREQVIIYLEFLKKYNYFNQNGNPNDNNNLFQAMSLLNYPTDSTNIHDKSVDDSLVSLRAWYQGQIGLEI